MKVTLHKNHDGELMIYVPKKDLEEAVVSQTWLEDVCTFTLANGWELQVPGLSEPLPTPKTVQAKRLN